MNIGFPPNQELNDKLKGIMDICGIEKNLTCHVARHTFATLALSSGIPIESVSKMLGHKNIQVTQLYAKIIDMKLSQDMDTFEESLRKNNI